MENLIPVLVIIVLFVFQAVNNYRKEQEKASKRNTGAPRTGNGPARTIPQPVPVREEPTFSEVVQEHAASPYDAFAGPIEKVKHINVTSRPSHLASSLRAEAYRLDAQDEEEDGVQLDEIRDNFNLKEAVIMSAILERPYA